MSPHEIALGSAATLIMGTSPKGETYNSGGEGLPLLNGPTEFGPSHPECTVFTTDSKRQCKPGDLIFCVRGSTTGRMNWADRVYSLGRGVCAIRGGSPLETKFIRYAIDLRLEALLKLSGGATFPNLTGSDIAGFQIPFPENRHAIASILSAYDDLIENNTRRIRVLKEMARTIFQGATADSWMLVPVSELYEELFDGPHATPKPSTTGPIYLGIKNVTERGELDLTDIRHIAEEDFPQWTRRVVPRPGDIVFTYEATLNRYGIINQDFRGCLGRRMALIRPDERRIDPFLFLQCLLSDQWRDEVRSKIISGATVDRIPLTTFPTFQVRVPGPDARERIGPPIRACEELAENCRRRNDVLRTTRDFLLPKLISGEIPVDAADEAAAGLTEQTA